MDSAPPRRKEVILEAATRLFAERGYEGASMADLAELVGLRKASLFHHYLGCRISDGFFRRVLLGDVQSIDLARKAASTDIGEFLFDLCEGPGGKLDVKGVQPIQSGQGPLKDGDAARRGRSAFG